MKVVYIPKNLVVDRDRVPSSVRFLFDHEFNSSGSTIKTIDNFDDLARACFPKYILSYLEKTEKFKSEQKSFAQKK